MDVERTERPPRFRLTRQERVQALRSGMLAGTLPGEDSHIVTNAPASAWSAERER